jgi:hypothetical protein
MIINNNAAAAAADDERERVSGLSGFARHWIRPWIRRPCL